MTEQHQCYYDLNNWQCPICHQQPGKMNGYYSLAPALANCSSGFNPEHFSLLYTVEASNFWFRSRNQLLIWALKKYFTASRSFFEIGCGTGFVLSGIHKAFPHLSLYGSDIYTSSLPYATKRLPTAKLFQMDATDIPFQQQFDVIGAFDVLEHIKYDELALSQMYAALRPNGGLILTVPQHQYLWSKVDERACHERRYSAEELIKKVTNAGFKIQKITSFVSFLLPLMFWSRYRLKNSDRPFNAEQEVKLGYVSNLVLETVMNIERWFIRIGFHFPMGGSLLLVATRS